MARALIVAKEKAVLEATHAALEQLQFEMVASRAEENVLELIRQEPPQLLILDGALTVAGALCRALRKDPALADLPIIAITPEGSIAERVAALESGADDCVTEPLHVDELVARIKALR